MGNTVTTGFLFEQRGKGLADMIRDLDTADDRAKAVADAISQMADEIKAETERAEAATDALAKSLGPEMVTKLEQGGNGVAGMVDNLRKLGLTYDEIEAKADMLAASMRKVEDVKVDSTREQLTGTAGDVDKLSDSARGANSALANMIGNSAQDLGAMGGIAGSAGVAIGQMAEYAGDATLAGEGLGSALKSMAMVAGPIAALTIGMQLLAHFIGKGKDQADELRKSTDEVTQAIAKAQDAGEDLDVTLEKLASNRVDKALGEIADKLPGLVSSFDTLGISYDDVVEAFESGQGPLVDALKSYDEMHGELGRGFRTQAEYQAALERVARARGVSKSAIETEWVAVRKIHDALADEQALSATSIQNAQAMTEWRGRHAGAADTEARSVEEVRRALFRQGEITADVTASTEAQTAADLAAAEAADRRRAAIDAVREAEDRRLNAALKGIGGDIGIRAANMDAIAAFNDPNMSFDQKLTAVLSAANQVAAIRQTQLEANGNRVDTNVQAQLLKDSLAGFSSMFGQMFLGDNAGLELGDAIADALRGYINEVNNSIAAAQGRGDGRGVVINGVAMYDDGGVVPGPGGKPQLAVVHGGEEVLSEERRRWLERANIDPERHAYNTPQLVQYPHGYPAGILYAPTINVSPWSNPTQVVRELYEMMETASRQGVRPGTQTLRAWNDEN